MGSWLDGPAVRTATSDYPELCVEWLPNQGPFAPDGDWCDITAYVSAGSCSTGRQYELERFQAGTLSLTLLSDTRLFDPEWSTGPFYPWLVPMRQVRVSAVWNSTRYPVWRGYITDWGQTVPAADSQFVTTVVAKDALALFEAMTLGNAWYETVVTADRPLSWWRLDETTGTVANDSGFGSTVWDGAYVGSPTLDSSALLTYDEGRKGVLLNGTSQYVTARQFVTSSEAPAQSLEMWIKTTSTVGSSDQYLWGGPMVSTPDFRFVIEATTGKALAYWDATSPKSVTSTARVDDSAVHHIVVTTQGRSAGPVSVALYVDGVQVATTSWTDGVGSPPSTWVLFPSAGGNPGAQWIGNATISGTNYPFPGTIAEVAFYGSALSSTQVLAHYNAGVNAFTGEATGTRLGRVLDLKGWPATLRDLDTGASTVGAYELSGQTVAEYVQQLADTEAGQTYVGPDGVLVHRNRQNLWLEARSQTSQATFGDEHSAATLKYVAEGFELPRDETRIRNPVSASRSGGITVTKTDAAYVEKYGERGWSAPTSLDSSDNVIADRAAYFLSRYKELGTRLAAMTVAPMSDPTNLWPQVLGRQIGDRITIKRTPLGTGNEISTEQIIEGITHTFTPRTWKTVYRGSPAETTIYFILDDATYGVLDDDKLAY